MTTNSSTGVEGPALLEERPLLGIGVHLVGLATGAVGPGIVYLASNHEYTRENARNALNWYLCYTAVTLLTLGSLLGWILVVDLLPDVVGLLLFLPVFAAFEIVAFLTFLTLAFCLIATVKAIFGEAWAYPGAPDLI